jgi:hypothetical protein
MNRLKLFGLALVVSGGTLAACSHQTEFYGGHVSIDADMEFQRELGRHDVDVKKCYAAVNSTEKVPLEMVADENGKPLAARATGPLFGSTLGGCLETVAFRIKLRPGNGRRIAHATAGPHPIAAEAIAAGDDSTAENLPPPAAPQATTDGGVPPPQGQPR